MFDIGFFEICLIAVVALIVLGPEKMPHAMRMCAAYWGRLKRSMLETKLELEEQLAMEDIRRQLKQEQAKIQALIDQQQQLEEKKTDDPNDITESSDKTPDVKKD